MNSLTRQYIRVTSGILSTQFGDDMVLLSLPTKRYYGLNASGVQLWNDLLSFKSKGQLVDSLTREFDVSTETAQTDVENLLTHLLEVGLVSVSA